MKKVISVSLISAAIFIGVSCHKSTPVPNGTTYLDLPSTPYVYYSGFANTDTVNSKATLGRVLFYDNHMSVNNSVSCGSCHKQAAGFADNVSLSNGFDNRLTARNSKGILNEFGRSQMFLDPTIMILSQEQPLFWDGRESILKNLVNRPITNHVEMGIDNPDQDLPARLSPLSYYNQLFFNAYGDKNITSDRISECIAIFMGAIQSNNSRFNLYQAGNRSILSAIELQGMNLFASKYNCENCHHVIDQGVYTFADFKDIGLDDVYTDLGRGAITKQPTDMGLFRVPSLENVALTAPYMHDGRYKTLEDVVDHYSHSIKKSPNLDTIFIDTYGQPKSLNIPDEDKAALVAFLNTLTDFSTVTDPKLSNPFKVK